MKIFYCMDWIIMQIFVHWHQMSPHYSRPCLNELHKEYCVKTKVIALGWLWVTLISWCQMNRNGHSSPVQHKVEVKPYKIFEKLKITYRKSTLFGHFFWGIFRSPVFTSVFLLIHMVLPLYFTVGFKRRYFFFFWKYYF